MNAEQSKLMNRIVSLYRLELRVLQPFADLFLLLLRGYFGYRFFKTGYGKLTNVENVTRFFDSLGIPFPELNVYIAGSTECVGGILLMVGFLSRVISIPLIFTMVTAYLTAHYESVQNLFNDPSTFFDQEPFLFLLTCIIVLLWGAGRISLDYILYRLTGMKDLVEKERGY